MDDKQQWSSLGRNGYPSAQKFYNLFQPGEGLEVHKVPELTLNVNNFRYTFSQFLTMVLPTFIHAL